MVSTGIPKEYAVVLGRSYSKHNLQIDDIAFNIYD